MALPMTLPPTAGASGGMAAPPPTMGMPPGMMGPAPGMAQAQGGPDFVKLMAQLAQKGQGGQLPPEVMTILTFLAGVGADPFSKVVERMRGPQPKTAAGKDAKAAAPGAAPNPQLAQVAQLIAARRGMMPGMQPLGAPPMMPPTPVA